MAAAISPACWAGRSRCWAITRTGHFAWKRKRSPAAAPGELSLAARIIAETLRLEQSEYIVRVARRPLSVGGFRIPAGWLLRLCVRESHRDPTAFTDPDRFDPDRFPGPATRSALLRPARRRAPRLPGADRGPDRRRRRDRRAGPRLHLAGWPRTDHASSPPSIGRRAAVSGSPSPTATAPATPPCRLCTCPAAAPASSARRGGTGRPAPGSPSARARSAGRRRRRPSARHRPRPDGRP